MQKHGKKEASAGMVRRVVIGTGTSVLTTVIGAFITAWLIDQQNLMQEHIDFAAMIIIGLSGILGSLTAVVKATHNKLFSCIGVGIGYFAVLLLSAVLLFEGIIQGVAVTFLLIVGSAICVALMGATGKTNVKKRSFKKSYS